MTSSSSCGMLRFAVAVFALAVLTPVSISAQESSFVLPRSSAESSLLVSVASSSASKEHRFWDPENRALIVAVTALNIADFAVTRANLQRGGRELNPMARVFGRSTPGLAANFADQTVGVIGVSYLLHKTGHHKLERIAS